QLSMAGLIPWSFSGANIVGGTTWPTLVPGTNVPSSGFNPGIGYVFYSVRTTAANGYYKKTIEIGAGEPPGSNGDVLFGAGLTGPQASSLDLKFDDGGAESGRIFAVSGGSTILAYNTVATRASTVNGNTTCVASHLYLTSASSGCTMEYTPDV